jgi:hypothetical protein
MVMYACRRMTLDRLGEGKWFKNDKEYTQKILPNYLLEHPEETADWDVVYDDRGHFYEPHTGLVIGMGTRRVRAYVGAWAANPPPVTIATTAPRFMYPTKGPAHRFKYALVCEKEGFQAIFEAAHLQEMYDLAILSPKGMSTTACRRMVEEIHKAGGVIFVLRDFDKSGFSLVQTVSNDTRRYTFEGGSVPVIDLGLRLTDIQALGLKGEPVIYGNAKKPPPKNRPPKDPRINLRENGATDDECEFLVTGKNDAGRWVGQRVELNELTAEPLVNFVKRKFAENGVTKIIPDLAVLEDSYKRCYHERVAHAAYQKALAESLEMEGQISTPDDLQDRVQTLLVANPLLPWDQAVAAEVDTETAKK